MTGGRGQASWDALGCCMWVQKHEDSGCPEQWMRGVEGGGRAKERRWGGAEDKCHLLLRFALLWL